MLTAYRRGLLPFVATALLALGSTGCNAVLKGTHDAPFHVTVAPMGGTSFFWWTKINVDGDLSSVGTTDLWAVTLAVDSPPEADLTFLSNIQGAAVKNGTLTPLAKADSFERGETTANMTILYFDDLHNVFDGSTITINWTGATNPAFTAWPAEGITMSGNVTINVE